MFLGSASLLPFKWMWIGYTSYNRIQKILSTTVVSTNVQHIRIQTTVNTASHCMLKCCLSE